MRGHRITRVAGLAAALTVLAAPVAAAQNSYPPETLSSAVLGCGEGEIVLTVDGAQPNSTVHIVFDWANIPDSVYDSAVDANGHLNGTYPLPITDDTGAVFSVTISGLDYDPNKPAGVPFQSVLTVDRAECPDLPNTGSDSLPIGKIALIVTLAGALLVVVALRRRPREEVEAAA